MSVPILIFPGMDGTGALLSAFKSLAPDDFKVSVLDLPIDIENSYDALADHFVDVISLEKNCVLVGESFSGPLVVRLAARLPECVVAIVLAASFVTAPLTRVLRVVPWSLVFRFPLPGFIARKLLLGPGCESEIVGNVCNTVRSVPSGMLSRRMQEIIRVDMRAELADITCPILYLRPLQDRIIPKACVASIVEARPEVVVARIEGPHLILQTHPMQAWRQIASFVRDYR